MDVMPAVDDPPDAKERLYSIHTVQGNTIFVSEKKTRSADGRYELWLHYYCENKDFYQATHKEVCASHIVEI